MVVLTIIRILICIQMLGIAGSIVASLVEIESIVASGPVFSAVGLAIALLCYRRRRPLGIYFGISAPTISVVCFAIIFGLQWSPEDAAAPISMLLVLFGVPALPLGVAALHEEGTSATGAHPRKLQYRIKTLLGLTTLVAIVCGLTRTGNTLAVAIGVLLAYGSLCCFVLVQYHRRESIELPPEDGGDSEVVIPVVVQEENPASG